MPATGPDVTRRGLLLACAAAITRAADPAQDAWDVVTRLAAALGRANAVEFMALCDPGMPHYEDLRVNVTALTEQADAESGIDPVRNEGDVNTREVELDWSMQLTGRSVGRVTQRRSTVKLRIVKKGREWKVLALAPISFFAAPSA